MSKIQYSPITKYHIIKHMPEESPVLYRSHFLSPWALQISQIYIKNKSAYTWNLGYIIPPHFILTYFTGQSCSGELQKVNRPCIVWKHFSTSNEAFLKILTTSLCKLPFRLPFKVDCPTCKRNFMNTTGNSVIPLPLLFWLFTIPT